MPRGGSRGGSRGTSRSPPPRNFTTASRPMQQTQIPQQQSRSGGMLSGIGSTIMTGMAFGAGSQVAHQAVRGVMGGSHSNQHIQQTQSQSQQTYQNPCQMQIQSFSNCLQMNDDVSYCQNYSDMLKSCKKSHNL